MCTDTTYRNLPGNQKKRQREIQNAKWDAMMQLQKLPANSSKVRKHNRCGLTGRPRGYMRQFGISRVTFREMALSGKIPGVKKASW